MNMKAEKSRQIGLRLRAAREKAHLTQQDLAQKLGLDMPIVNVVYSILYEGADPRECVVQLMGRPLKRERD